MNTTHRPQIVVLGGGYAGTMAANRLSAEGTAAEITVVNAHPRFVHRIRLHQWIAGTGTAEEDYRHVLSDRVRLVVDTATRIADGRVELASGAALDYDHLVYAVGSSGTAADAIDGLAEYGFALGEWEAAQRLRDHLAEVDTTDDKRPVTVVGGGLTGMEMAAELADAGVAVRLVCGATLAPSFGVGARRAARRRLRKLGVEILEDSHVTAVGADTVTIVEKVQRRVEPSSTTIVAAGFGVPDLAAVSGLSTDAIGRLITDETLSSVDDPRIVGAGDAVAPSGTPFRMSCQAANQLGPHAADTVLARLAGTEPTPIRLAFVGQCTSLGRHGAVVQVTHRDDTPARAVISGRVGAAIKEVVCRSVIWGLRLEGRRPGVTPSFGRPREVGGREPEAVA
ncbi:NAD(P)/FAD-dependent oxidoreductase [Gordonia hankookensis]|uniref:FAD-dependent oxidoreductase n=1 Tax=Gordonia hankookensis TaxID=589403 RepID=A0ABR7W8N6_9ACTN|nr:FAD-dependent oxidoreductase [Gordonia hankookensis]MBD1318089.1 FAD-dependent oxidoreductase [Gordonia hankookensis]